MNNKVLDKVDEIITLIKESSEYKDYIYLKDKLSKHEKANILVNEIKKLQKQVVRLEANGDFDKELEQELNLKIDELNKIPLYNDYNEILEKLNNMYGLIKERLDNYFYSKFN